MTTENKTNTSTTTNTNITSNSAEVIEKTKGLYEATNRATAETIKTVDEMVEAKVAKAEEKLNESVKDKVKAQVTVELDKAVKEKTSNLQSRLDESQDKVVSYAEHLDTKEILLNRKNRQIVEQAERLDEFDKKVERLTTERIEFTASNIRLQKEVDESNHAQAILEGRVNSNQKQVEQLNELHANTLSNMDKQHNQRLDFVEKEATIKLDLAEEMHEKELQEAMDNISSTFETEILNMKNKLAEKDREIRVLRNDLNIFKDLAKQAKLPRFVQAMKIIFNK